MSIVGLTITIFLQTQLRSTLEALVQPGLVELNLVVEFPSTIPPADRSAIGDVLVVFAKWASATAPSLVLRVSCRAAVKGDWQWPDLGQGHRGISDPFGMGLPSLDTFFAQWDDEYDEIDEFGFD